MNIRQLSSKLAPKQWAMVGGAGLVLILFFFMLMSFASQPSYTTLLAGMDPAQTGKDTAALDAKGITYQIGNGGTEISVLPAQLAQARIALAGAGLLGSQQPGMTLFDNAPLGQSNFQSQIMYQRALEGQLSNSIQSIQGISSAQVQLVLPDPQSELFASQSTPSSAAVLLSDSGSLDPNQIKGIATMVASSVPSLNPSKVTITDQTGALLWPTSDSGNGQISKEQAQSRYDSTTAAAADALLATTLGPGKAEVQVNADLNTNQTTSDTLTYAKKGTPLQQTVSSETLKGAGTTNGGIAGQTGTTAPAYAATSGGASNYRNKQTNTTYGVDKTVTHSIVAPGAINRQSVSVLVDKSVPASELPSLRAAVAAAVGLNAKRGDTISFGQIKFAPLTPTTAPVTGAAGPQSMIKYAKYGLTALGSIIFLFFMRRLLRRREDEILARQPTWLRELESPRSLASFDAELDEAPTIAALKPPVNVAKLQIEELVERDPDRVAQQVRAWMGED